MTDGGGKNLAKWENELNERESSLNRKDADLKKKMMIWDKKDSDLQTKTEQFEKRESALAQREASVHLREENWAKKQSEAQERDRLLSKREVQLREMEREDRLRTNDLKDREQQVERGQQTMTIKEKELKEQERHLGEQFHKLTRLDEELRAAEESMQERVTHVQERETSLNNLEETLGKREAKVQYEEHELQELRTELETKDKQLRKKQKEVEEKEVELVRWLKEMLWREKEWEHLLVEDDSHTMLDRLGSNNAPAEPGARKRSVVFEHRFNEALVSVQLKRLQHAYISSQVTQALKKRRKADNNVPSPVAEQPKQDLGNVGLPKQDVIDEATTIAALAQVSDEVREKLAYCTKWWSKLKVSHDSGGHSEGEESPNSDIGHDILTVEEQENLRSLFLTERELRSQFNFLQGMLNCPLDYKASYDSKQLLLAESNAWWLDAKSSLLSRSEMLAKARLHYANEIMGIMGAKIDALPSTDPIRTELLGTLKNSEAATALPDKSMVMNGKLGKQTQITSLRYTSTPLFEKTGGGDNLSGLEKIISEKATHSKLPAMKHVAPRYLSWRKPHNSHTPDPGMDSTDTEGENSPAKPKRPRNRFPGIRSHKSPYKPSKQERQQMDAATQRKQLQRQLTMRRANKSRAAKAALQQQQQEQEAEEMLQRATAADAVEVAAPKVVTEDAATSPKERNPSPKASPKAERKQRTPDTRTPPAAEAKESAAPPASREGSHHSGSARSSKRATSAATSTPEKANDSYSDGGYSSDTSGGPSPTRSATSSTPRSSVSNHSDSDSDVSDSDSSRKKVSSSATDSDSD
eukprot:NODE_67_length_2660_cov_87.161863_g47_i0.p1 GENE.NODE_67_length_2660_cov_87.161863_g47_i0~~NODE_67_length_2660_cov_87.161863_g47_i0.p1  ORF type:complete len:811 (+),score=170.41 NODE_67_length_2660_cov_87.161863_g47_i0:176-2608(+)